MPVYRGNAPYRRGGPIPGETGLTPNMQAIYNQQNRSYWNPGNGWMGNDVTSGGQVFGGFQRGGHQGGWTGFMSGMGPAPGQTGAESFRNFFSPDQLAVGSGQRPDAGMSGGMRDFFGSSGVGGYGEDPRAGNDGGWYPLF